ncbi:MAG: pyruvate formate-lyase-activating protein [Candidatus Ornithomonoglobus sp.]
MNGRIHSLESFGTVDGPGIRFVIFFQGCPMRCLYCHNPDSWDPKGGTEMTAEEILQKADSVREFLKNGGITATGGEPLMQLEFLTELFRRAKDDYSFHTCLDTSGVTFNEKNRAKFDELMKYTNLVMLDIKHIDPDEHKKLTSQKQDNIIAFARYLSDNGIPVWIRHVLVPGITQNDEYLYKLGQFIGTLRNIKAVDVLPYHDMGKTKYEKLGIEYPLKDTKSPSEDETVHARQVILDGMKNTHNDNVK